jgi:hypothetical protein
MTITTSISNKPAEIVITQTGGTLNPLSGIFSAGIETSVAGKSAIAEQQQVSVISDDASGTFKLSFNYQENTYTTEDIALNAGADTIQQALLTASSTINDADIVVKSIKKGIWNISFTGALAGYDFDLMAIDSTMNPIPAEFTLIQEGAANTDGGSTVIDFAARSLDIINGPGSTITLDMDGSKGELIRASGNVEIGVSEFFYVEGGFAFEKSDETVTLADGSSVDTDLLTVGGENINAFAGLGPKDSDNALGFDLNNADFALALFAPKDSADNRSWTALAANADEAAFIGSEDIDINAQNIGVMLNLVKNDDQNVIDFASSLTIKAKIKGSGCS